MLSIRKHSLAWRWTDPKYAVLPDEVLEQMAPLDPHAAAEMHNRWMPFYDQFGDVKRVRFEDVDVCSTEGTWTGDCCRREDPILRTVTDWLRDRESDLQLPVTVSWRRDCAIRTKWEIVSRWWDDFFYPSSDDAFVVPDEPLWFLSFHHEDTLSFCRRPVV